MVFSDRFPVLRGRMHWHSPLTALINRWIEDKQIQPPIRDDTGPDLVKNILRYIVNCRITSFFAVIVFVLQSAISPGYTQEIKEIPADVYIALDYIFSLSDSQDSFDPDKVKDLVDFVDVAEGGSHASLQTRNGADGAFFTFDINGELSDILNYTYHPDIPPYVTMPSSLQNHEWLTQEIKDDLRNLVSDYKQTSDIRLLRGSESEVITPDTHTGGYYAYTQDRLLALMPGAAGPVLISATIQSEPSVVGKKGCVAGDDKDWNYLYSRETGINKKGLSWVDSYMYFAYSVIIYVSNSSTKTINTGNFKWLNAGWAKINMVKSHHILKGMKRFAADFKDVLESPNLPEASILADKYQELAQMSEQELRQQVAPYLQGLKSSGDLKSCPDSFTSLVSSGEYLQQMSSQEMIRILMLDYLKEFVAASSRDSAGSLSLKREALPPRS